MKVNVKIDTELLQRAMKLIKMGSEQLTVEKALGLFIRLKEQEQVRSKRNTN